MYYGDFSDFGDFGIKIRAARLKMGLKKKEAAVLIGMYPSYYGYVERSMVLPKYNKLKTVCDTLGISLCYLFSDANHVVFNLKNYSDKKQNLIKLFYQTIDCLNNEKTIDCLNNEKPIDYLDNEKSIDYLDNEKTVDCLDNEKTVDWTPEDILSTFGNLSDEQRRIIAAFLEEFKKLIEVS